MKLAPLTSCLCQCYSSQIQRVSRPNRKRFVDSIGGYDGSSSFYLGCPLSAVSGYSNCPDFFFHFFWSDHDFQQWKRFTLPYSPGFLRKWRLCERHRSGRGSAERYAHSE